MPQVWEPDETQPRREAGTDWHAAPPTACSSSTPGCAYSSWL